MIHHGDEQIQEHHNVYDRIAPKHQHSPEASENLYAVQLEAVQVDESENGPEQRLCCLPEAAARKLWAVN